ncbi:MAG: FtsX-like permease family protein [Verrucomicrobiota bacterium]
MNHLISWVKFAARNLLRNKRRSVVTIAAAALGFAAVNVFGGFTNYLFVNLRDAFIYVLGNGHVQIYVSGYNEHGTSDPDRYLLNADTFRQLQEIGEEDPRILLTTGSIDVSGQIDTGDKANIFIGRAITPSHREEMLKNAKTLTSGFSLLGEGEQLTDDDPYQIGVATGMQETLELELGADIVLMARTLDGQLNVVDAIVKNTFSSPTQDLSDKLIAIPLELAQELYQTDRVGSVSMMLRSRHDVPAIQQLLTEKLKDADQTLTISTWDTESDLYKLTRNMFDMIFGMVFLILIVIVTMSVMNTMSMAIMERTTEIGTLRALGLKRRGVIGLFGIEGLLLGVIGSLIGMLVTFGVYMTVQILEPQWTPPTIARKMQLEIRLVPHYLCLTFFFLAVLTLAAAIIPARRAAKGGIVEALGHV